MPAFEIELNGTAAVADVAGIAATGDGTVAATDPDAATCPGVGRGPAVAAGAAVPGPDANGAATRVSTGAVGASIGTGVGIDALFDPAAGTWGGAEEAKLENAGGGTGAGADARGSAVVAGDFEGWLDTEPNDWAIAGPDSTVSSVATRAAAVMRRFIGRRL